MTSGKVITDIKRTPSSLRDISFSPDGKTLATSHRDANVRLWDVATGEERAFRIGHKDQLYQVRFSPDGKLLASASNDETINVWDDKGVLLMTLPGHTDGSLSLAFSPDGKTLASGGWDHSVKLWDVNTGKQRALLGRHDERIMAVDFSPDGKTLASCGGNDIKLWDVATLKERTTFKDHEKWAVRGIAFTPDGNQLVYSAFSGEVRVRYVPRPKKPRK
jgi:WD40 repeat protein